MLKVSCLLSWKSVRQLFSVRKMACSKSFKLTDYDCICLDLDNALCRYNITNLLKLQYKLLKEQMIKRNYPEKYFPEDLSPEDVDFIQKGLFMDFERGNILYLRDDGYILKASHGTRAMSDSQIEEEYGKSRRWVVTDQFCKDVLSTWNGPLSDKMRSFLDYTDCQASLVFARAVESVDCVQGRPEKYNIWPDLLQGIVDMFMPGSGYSETLRARPSDYIIKNSSQLLSWLKELKNRGVRLVLITGSGRSSASFTARKSLGEGWEELFDMLLFHAQKPAFFSQRRPFMDVNEESECTELKFGGIYNRGNWETLREAVIKECKKDKPKCIYIGDNLIQDVYAPAVYTDCETVAVVEEMLAEGLYPGCEPHPDAPYITSKRWGSYLWDADSCCDTVWGGIVKKYSRICIPSMDVFLEKPVDFEFVPIWPGVCKN